MKTKEAIEWIKTKVFCVDTMGDEKKLRDFECNQDSIIELLKRGEKYEAIVKSIEWHIKTSKECNPEVYGWLKFIERIIKHFPKEESCS